MSRFEIDRTPCTTNNGPCRCEIIICDSLSCSYERWLAMFFLLFILHSSSVWHPSSSNPSSLTAFLLKQPTTYNHISSYNIVHSHDSSASGCIPLNWTNISAYCWYIEGKCEKYYESIVCFTIYGVHKNMTLPLKEWSWGILTFRVPSYF